MKYLLTTFILLLGFSLYAQNADQSKDGAVGKMSFGFIGGVSITDLPFTQPFYVEGESINTNNEVTYFAGVALRRTMKNRFAALLEAQYAVKGFRIASAPLENRWHFHYLDFIPQVEYNVYRGFHVSLGGYWGILLEERFKEGDGDWNKVDRSFFQYARNNDFGAVGGISFRHKRFSALLRYQHGINLASKGVQYTNDIGEVVNLSQRNRTLMLGLGFNIL
ncbi:MAG: PorT family protein [Saprospiraceae bacterium]|nr:PorT family protein [Saprospiraceae bacterium]